MYNAPRFIKENCPSCHPQKYTKTLAEFTGKVEQIAFVDSDGTSTPENEYLYKCVKCGALMWVDENWAKENAVEDKTGGNEEMNEKNMVLVDIKELKEISLTLAESLGEDSPVGLIVGAMEDLEKVIEKSRVHPVIDVVALRGIAEVLDIVLNSAGSSTITRKVEGIEQVEELSREEALEIHLEDALEGILGILGDREGK